jgi:DNA-binding cell septation regulator SpoVG
MTDLNAPTVREYRIYRDSHNRLCAEITEDVVVGIKILSEVDPRRVEKRVHAYAVLDVRTELGPIRIRDIKIMWSPENERYFLRWRQWNTGKSRDGRPEYLDVAGPQDKETRYKFEDEILNVFHQVREEAQRGTLARQMETRESLGPERVGLTDNEIAAKAMTAEQA